MDLSFLQTCIELSPVVQWNMTRGQEYRLSSLSECFRDPILLPICHKQLVITCNIITCNMRQFLVATNFHI